ncbi:hypothetical protein M406DRAFT_331264 [Cryphonectria parasitica EP155]|uniref:N-acetylglucosamine-induced protein 1 n=1 Tax=Cryphonectria parasitica (strain ATCC 38755 / EP155) TaxID=660469 RepID=A0A9P4Y1U5_CRYP1|nr:uncharacterized protein M406DRAFT_331264 [Cryphonectria parasitica EP155]KAF3764948.1 hypothetical protein M406DRAFT_331264 [Cryphonectria parasitica EP155]
MGSNPDVEALPFWQVNIAPKDREDECPEPLRDLSAKDVRLIGTRDEDYHVQTWDEVVNIVGTGRLGDFRRWPTELRRYREFVWRLSRAKGGVMGHMLNERLHWTLPLVPQGSRPFVCEEDFKILWNDWPYGIDRRIVHLVVWTKFELRDDAETRCEIGRFIDRTFLPVVTRDKLIWFKNPPSLKSVHSVEHIHVMLFDPDLELINRLTNGDKPQGHLLSDINGCRW